MGFMENAASIHGPPYSSLAGSRKDKKKQAKEERDRQKQLEKKRRRLEKALATSAAIRSELEKKKQRKKEEEQRLDEEGAALAEAVALYVLLEEEPKRIGQINSGFNGFRIVSGHADANESQVVSCIDKCGSLLQEFPPGLRCHGSFAYRLVGDANRSAFCMAEQKLQHELPVRVDDHNFQAGEGFGQIWTEEAMAFRLAAQAISAFKDNSRLG